MCVYHLITLITLEILIYNSTLIVFSSLWSPIPSPPILTDTLSVDWLCSISSVLGNSNGCDGDDEDDRAISFIYSPITTAADSIGNGMEI